MSHYPPDTASGETLRVFFFLAGSDSNAAEEHEFKMNFRGAEFLEWLQYIKSAYLRGRCDSERITLTQLATAEAFFSYLKKKVSEYFFFCRNVFFFKRF